MERILTVAANEPIAPGVFRLLLDGAAVDDVRAPGQFFNLSVDGFYLRRPISVCDAENGRVTLIYKVVGAGTRALSEYRRGQTVSALTALGNGYDLNETGERPLLLGGGAGVPPMYLLAKALLARMYTDPVLADLLINGVEGMHYEVEPETGLIHFPEGVTAQNNGYSQFRGWAWPNQTIAHSWSGGSDDPAGDLRAFNASCEVSIAYGFSFDSAPVAGAARRCQEVVSYYLPMLEAGVGDETLLDSFLAELEEAGIGEVIQEKQRQLDAWLAAGEAGERA